MPRPEGPTARHRVLELVPGPPRHAVRTLTPWAWSILREPDLLRLCVPITGLASWPSSSRSPLVSGGPSVLALRFPIRAIPAINLSCDVRQRGQCGASHEPADEPSC